MTTFFTPHARLRAMERYGLELSSTDMMEILRATKDGRAQLMKNTPEAGRIYIMTFRGRSIIPVIDRERELIVSFMPSDYFVASVRRAHKGLVGHKSRVAHGIEGREYRRPKSNRRALSDQAAAEEE